MGTPGARMNSNMDPENVSNAYGFDSKFTPDKPIVSVTDLDELPESEEDEGNNDDDFKVDDTLGDTDDVDERALVSKWMTEDVRLPQYIDVFFENGLEDTEVILTLTNDDLKDIGVKILGHRKKIMLHIKKKLENMKKMDAKDADAY